MLVVTTFETTKTRTVWRKMRRKRKSQTMMTTLRKAARIRKTKMTLSRKLMEARTRR